MTDAIETIRQALRMGDSIVINPDALRSVQVELTRYEHEEFEERLDDPDDSITFEVDQALRDLSSEITEKFSLLALEISGVRISHLSHPSTTSDKLADLQQYAKIAGKELQKLFSALDKEVRIKPA